MSDWKEIAAKKRDSVLKLIPKEWRIQSPPAADEQRDVTGPYIQQYLDRKEIEITETDAVGIVEKTSSGQWTAMEVAKAFCHRAALAHQLVGALGTSYGRPELMFTGQLLARDLFRGRLQDRQKS